MKPTNALAKFGFYYTPGDSNDCWPWNGPTNGGHGILIHEGKNIPITKLAWFKAYQVWPKRVFYTCQNKACANPNHMSLKSPSNPNMARPNNPGRAVVEKEKPIFTCICTAGNGLVYSPAKQPVYCQWCGSNWGVVDEECDVLCMMCGRPFGSVQLLH